jgi:hypothetical protein
VITWASFCVRRMAGADRFMMVECEVTPTQQCDPESEFRVLTLDSRT